MKPKRHFKRLGEAHRTVEFLNQAFNVRKTGGAGNDENAVGPGVGSKLNLSRCQVVGGGLNISVE